jgi:hypothetical protein
VIAHDVPEARCSRIGLLSLQQFDDTVAMRWSWMVVLCVGCGNGSDASPTGPIGEPAVLFGGRNALYRFVDVNADGRFDDAGEPQRFFMESSADLYESALPLDRRSALVEIKHRLDTPPFFRTSLDKVIDANDDGDAMDDGERTVWFSGGLPGGADSYTVRPFAQSSDGAIFAVTSPQTVQNRVIRLQDVNGDGDADDAGEVVEIAALDAGDWHLALDHEDQLWIGVESQDGKFDPTWYRLENNARVPKIDGSAIRSASDDQLQIGRTLTFLPNNEPCFTGNWAFTSGNTLTLGWNLYAWSDRDGDGGASRAELAKVWSPGGASVAIGADVSGIEDGSVLIVSASHVLRVLDTNGDGTFSNDETREVFDAYVAEANGFTNYESGNTPDFATVR